MTAVLQPSRFFLPTKDQPHLDTRATMEITPQQEAAELARLGQLESEALDGGVDFFRSEFAHRMGMPGWRGGRA